MMTDSRGYNYEGVRSSGLNTFVHLEQECPFLYYGDLKVLVKKAGTGFHLDHLFKFYVKQHFKVEGFKMYRWLLPYGGVGLLPTETTTFA